MRIVPLLAIYELKMHYHDIFPRKNFLKPFVYMCRNIAATHILQMLLFLLIFLLQKPQAVRNSVVVVSTK